MSTPTVRSDQSARGATRGGVTRDRGGAPIIEIVDVTFAYKSEVVLDRISIDIRQGEFVSLIGPSGCGKSTLLYLLDAASKPDAGAVLVDGKPVTRGGRDRAMVFQDFALFPWMTVLGNVTFALERQCPELNAAERREKAKYYLGKVGLTPALEKYPHQISGGMRQRVGLARAFAVESDILLMDEPFGALDAQNAEILREDLKRLVNEERRTVVFVTHNLDEAIQLSDRVLMMTVGPGRIKTDMRVDLPPSDSPDYERAFAERRAEMWQFLKAEVEKAQARERSSE